MRRVLVAGASAPLGRRLLETIRSIGGVERAIGVEPAAVSDWIDGVELVAFNSDHRELLDFIVHHQVDTVIHCGLAPDRGGDERRPSEARVIDTMRLGAAIGHEGSPVRAWVVASSSDVYPMNSHAPLLYQEDAPLDSREGTLAASLIEAEHYARDVAEYAAHLNVSILRLQQLVGEGIASPMTSVLDQPILPRMIGFDAPLQVLAVEDAVGALIHAAHYELAGVYNVASDGVLRYSQARQILGRRSVPVLPVGPGPLEPLARRLGIPHLPDGLLDLMLFGQAIDTSKLSASGFQAEYDQAGCLQTLRN